MDRRKRKHSHNGNSSNSTHTSDDHVTDENSQNPDNSNTEESQKDHNNSSFEKTSSEKKSQENITPALSKELNAPGAPRILLINQQANAEVNANERLLQQAIYNYQHQLRTPPSAKSQKLYLKGRSSGNQYTGFDRFDRVSDEIILRVFHFLPRHHMLSCSLVCRRWARIVCDLSLWRRMDLGGRLVKSGVLKIMLERGVEVLRLNRSEVNGDFSCTVAGSPDPRRSPLSEDRLYRLQYLDMSMANVNTKLVESMLRFCPNLQKISLENIPVTEQLLINLGLNSPYLETLNLCMSEGVTAKGLQVIFENCSSLSELNIAWTCLSSGEVMEVVKTLPSQITAFNMSGCRENMNDEVVQALCQRCPKIKKLDLSDSTHITNHTVDVIIDKLPHLRELSLSRCYQIYPMHVVHLGLLSHLEAINVYGMMRDGSLVAVEQQLSKYRINQSPFSTIARPTTSNASSVRIWNQPLS